MAAREPTPSPTPAPPVSAERSGPPVLLTSDEVAAVLRRAAELEGEGSPGDGSQTDRIDLTAVEQAAAEVGLSPAAVKRAYAELQVGSLGAQQAIARTEGGIIGPAAVAEQRVVHLSPDEVRARAGRFLQRQTFELRRSNPEFSLWRRRSDVAASVRRAFDFSKRIKLTQPRAITVHLTEVVDLADQPATLVRVEADLGHIKAGTAVATVGTPTAVAAAGGVLGVLFSNDPAWVMAAAGGWVPVTAGAVGLGRFLYGRERRKVAELLASFLDGLEG
ncbi:MAG: hypothetical protein ACRD29_09000 [Acidimicrobiales bacterium]